MRWHCHSSEDQNLGLFSCLQATELNIKQLTEDGLFDLIRTKSGLPDNLEVLPDSSKENVQIDEFKTNGKLCLDGIVHETKIKLEYIEIDVKKEETTVPGNYVDIP